MQGEMTVEDVRRELAGGSRVLLVVRHAERPKIGFDDKTFGASLPLTDEGARTSRAFGEMLRGASDDVQFRASPLRRTMMTAELIAEGMGLAGAEVVADAEIGNGSAFVADELEVWRLFSDGSFFEKMVRYMQDGVQRGFAPLAEAADAFESHAMDCFRARLGVFASHDVYIAAFLQARGVKTDLCMANWPRFLDSVAIIERPGGIRDYGFVRAGLSSRCCGIGVEEGA